MLPVSLPAITAELARTLPSHTASRPMDSVPPISPSPRTVPDSITRARSDDIAPELTPGAITVGEPARPSETRRCGAFSESVASAHGEAVYRRVNCPMLARTCTPRSALQGAQGFLEEVARGQSRGSRSRQGLARALLYIHRGKDKLPHAKPP